MVLKLYYNNDRKQYTLATTVIPIESSWVHVCMPLWLLQRYYDPTNKLSLHFFLMFNVHAQNSMVERAPIWGGGGGGMNASFRPLNLISTLVRVIMEMVVFLSRYVLSMKRQRASI